MKKISELFSKEELDSLSKYKPELVTMGVPSRDDLNLLDQPSFDQIIIKFFKQYEVNDESFWIKEIGDMCEASDTYSKKLI